MSQDDRYGTEDINIHPYSAGDILLGKKIAIEIETTPRNKEKNIEKCKGLFDEVISVDV